jgi:penicillin-binding protein 2
MRRAIAVSCDTYFYGVAQLIGVDRIHEFLGQFGFGRLTGIDIEGEKSGLLPSTDWKRKAFKRREMQVWFPGETVITGIGQGYLQVTPLQLAHATATIAARGRNFRPRLVHAVRDATTGAVREIPPVEQTPIKLADDKAWDVAIEGMVQVTSGPGGTARMYVSGTPYTMAGKTGTAQVFTVGQNEKYNESQVAERLRDHALFVAFAPAEKPTIAVAVLVENGAHGSSVASPMARRVFDVYLLPPDVLAAQDAKRKPAEVAGGGGDE